MAKFRKNLFCSKQPKIVLKYVPATLFVYVSDTSFRPISLKKELGHFSQKSLTPDMQKNSKNGKNRKILFCSKQLKIP